MSIHLKNAARLLKNAFLPDRTVGAFVDQALRGTNKSSKPVFKAMGEDLFEVVKNPIKAAGELWLAIRS